MSTRVKVRDVIDSFPSGLYILETHLSRWRHPVVSITVCMLIKLGKKVFKKKKMWRDWVSRIVGWEIIWHQKIDKTKQILTPLQKPTATLDMSSAASRHVTGTLMGNLLSPSLNSLLRYGTPFWSSLSMLNNCMLLRKHEKFSQKYLVTIISIIQLLKSKKKVFSNDVSDKWRLWNARQKSLCG